MIQPNNMNITPVSFKCIFRGFGIIKIVWKRVKYDMPVTVEVTEKKTINEITSILKFTKAAGYYAGQYYCVGESEVGEIVSQTANLHVQGNNYVSIYIEHKTSSTTCKSGHQVYSTSYVANLNCKLNS